MPQRFTWTVARDLILRARWIEQDPQSLAAEIGCGVSTLYKRAAVLGLPPRDPVHRRIKSGARPLPHISLPPLPWDAADDAGTAACNNGATLR